MSACLRVCMSAVQIHHCHCDAKGVCETLIATMQAQSQGSNWDPLQNGLGGYK